MKNLEVWYSHLNVENALQEYGSQFKPKLVKRAEKQFAKARTKDSMKAFSKLTEMVDGKPRIVDESPLIVPADKMATGDELERLFETLHRVLREYRETLAFDRRVLLEEFDLTDLAHKMVGVGSVGTRAWIALYLGRDGQDPLLLQVKEADPSVLEEFLGPSEFANHGERVVVGQRLMQATSDTASFAAGRWPARTPAAATGSLSPPTSATATASTARSSSSPRHTPTKTTATINSSPRQ
jgi:hypothetical protein